MFQLEINYSHYYYFNNNYVFIEPSITITVRTCRVNVPQSVRGRTTYVHLKDLVCPSPPMRGKKLSPEKLDNLIVPKPSGKLCTVVT